MPTFKFKSPDGKSYTVNGPEGSTAEQAFEILQGQLGVSPGSSSKKASDQIPNEFAGRTPTPQALARGRELAAPERTYKDDTLLGNIVGPVDAGAALLSSMAGGAVAPIGGFIQAAMNPNSKKGPEEYAGEIAQAMQYQPRTGTGAQLSRMAGEALAPIATLPTATIAQGAQAIGSGTTALRGMAGANAGAMAAQDAAVAAGGGSLRDLVRAPVGAPAAPAAPVLNAAGKVVSYPANVAKAIVQPFTKKGQDNISGQIIQKFAKDGPVAINAAEIIPGSTPTLAEATGNAGIARLQSATRDMAPNRFVEREAANSSARNTRFADTAGDQGKLDYFKQDRATVAQGLYSDAAKVDSSANMTPKVQKQIDALLERPSIQQASSKAKQFAAERGEKPSESGSLAGLHDTKTALDDMISKAVRDGEGGHAAALQATKDQLLGVIETLSPAYKEARQTYAAMSAPINQMEVLQGLKLKDQRGNITLQKVQSAIDTINKRINKPGLDEAKSLTSDQLNTLNTLRDDLLRQSNLGLGRSAGSNTFQNIATDNIISTILPGKIGQAVKDKIGGVIGQVGRLAYSGPNEAIKAKLIDKMLDPKLAEKDLAKLSDMSGKKKP